MHPSIQPSIAINGRLDENRSRFDLGKRCSELGFYLLIYIYIYIYSPLHRYIYKYVIERESLLTLKSACVFMRVPSLDWTVSMDGLSRPSFARPAGATHPPSGHARPPAMASPGHTRRKWVLGAAKPLRRSERLIRRPGNPARAVCVLDVEAAKASKAKPSPRPRS